MQENLKDRINYDATKDLNTKIGDRIREMRKEKHITQAQLAEALEVSVKHVSSVERGVASFSLERLVDTSYILGCSVEFLILGKYSEDLSSQLPLYVIEILRRNDSAEKTVLQEYLQMFEKLRGTR